METKFQAIGLFSSKENRFPETRGELGPVHSRKEDALRDLQKILKGCKSPPSAQGLFGFKYAPPGLYLTRVDIVLIHDDTEDPQELLDVLWDKNPPK